MTDQISGQTVDALVVDDLASTNGTAPTVPVHSVDDRLVRPRRRWPALLAGVAVGVGGTLAVRAALADDDGDDAATADPTEVVELATVAVEVRDIVEEVDWAGTLAVGEATTLGSPATGTLTDVIADGATIERGDVVARIDDHPVVAMFGATPMWRDLAVGDEGDDVFQLETNLTALGFDAEGIVTVDATYSSATADMVEAWQASLGVDETGDVAMRDVVVLPGESMVFTPVAVGSSVQAGATLATIEVPSVRFDVVGRTFDEDAFDAEALALLDDGEAGALVEAVAEPGTPVEHGTVLFAAAGVNAVAVVDITPETAAVLAAIDDGDIEEIESVLAFVGYDPDGAMEIDDEVDDATAAAVVRWQESIGLPSTGSVQAAAYVVVPGDREYVVAEPATVVGDAIGEGRLVVTLRSPTLSLAADVAVSEVDEFAVGDVVTVEQVDETTFTAVVVEIADTTTQSGQDEPTVLVSFDIVEPPEQLVSGSVIVTSESSRIEDAIVVPTRALVTLREGGFAVERADGDGARTLIAVDLGTFDDGVVEIVDGDLAAGDQVVVPS